MFLSTILLSIFSLIILFILTKLMGYRQISQLSAFDYINGITIGSIAAEMAIADEDHFMRPLLAMIIYGVSVLLVSIISSKSIHLRRFLVGKPYILMDNGEISRENLSKSKIDINEFLTQLRVNGFFHLAEIETVILEPDGRLSILPKSQFQSVCPQDLNLDIKPKHLGALIIVDGNVMTENLRNAGYDQNWLEKKLTQNHIHSVTEILIGTVTDDGTFDYYKISNHIPKRTNLI